jgi:hypothetical protein
MKKRIKNFKMFESPDSVKYKNLTLNWNAKDAIAFGYKDNKMFISDFSSLHYKNKNVNRKFLKFCGRLWINSKIISFWDFPKNYNELRNVLNDIEISFNLKNNEELKITNDWLIEIIFDNNKQIINKYKFWGPSNMLGDGRYINNSKLIKISDYIGSNKRTEEEMKIVHNLSWNEKEKLKKQGKLKYNGFGSEKQWNKVKGVKSTTSNNDMTPAEWEWYHKQESIFFNEAQNAQFTYNKQLNSEFWIKNLFNERLREKLITIANEFYNNFGYDVLIEDIILTGSLANYNYNEYSDLDIHIVIDFSKINNNVKLVKNAIDGYRFMWNLRHNIKIKGHDVELYIQDINEIHKASGLYSLLNAKWIVVPKYNQPIIDKELVNFKFSTYKSGIDELKKISLKNTTSEIAMKNHIFATEYKSKIMKGRKIGLEKKEAEFSVENLVFKKLRNSGYIEKLIDIIGIFYDQTYSQ